MVILLTKRDLKVLAGRTFLVERTSAIDLSAFTPPFLGVAPWFSFRKLFLPNFSLCGLVRANVQAWAVNILHFFDYND